MGAIVFAHVTVARGDGHADPSSGPNASGDDVGDGGRRLCAIGRVSDVTERHLQDEALRESKHRFRELPERTGRGSRTVPRRGMQAFLAKPVEAPMLLWAVPDSMGRPGPA